MKPDEANRIIAEFLGLTVHPSGVVMVPQDMDHIRQDAIPYSRSLDALVPVWEKLGVFSGGFVKDWNEVESRPINSFLIETDLGDFSSQHNETLELAAAIATAKAIQGLQK